MNDERELIYLAISNLIKDCLESLEGIEKLPIEQQKEDDKEMLKYILGRASTLEEKYREGLIEHKTDLTISRPNWADLDGSL